ncbi:MAG: hypothetical protein MK135_11840, partial [Polyangiaceae bacterium]|nr:hypothetical protein [Polyangiaceae bacterium]
MKSSDTQDVDWHAPSLKHLEWPQLLERIALRCRSRLAEEKVRSLLPAQSQEVAQLRQTLLGELLDRLGEDAEPPVAAVTDIALPLERAKRGAVVSTDELVAIQKVLATASGLRRYARQHADESPHLSQALATDASLSDLLRELNEALSDDGEILDTASSALAQARASTRSLRKKCQKKITECIHRYREALQDGFYAEREGRYVLPVRADAPFRVHGMVLGTSSSGSTFYVEPEELAQLGNQLRLAEVEVERELAKVLARLSAALLPHAEELFWALEVCVRADVLTTCAGFSRSIGARPIEFGSEGEISALGLKHPLLLADLEAVVASDLEVMAGRGLVLSGPNAGGKTVALKALGLMALMQSCGLPLPLKEESRIGFFRNIFCEIGDEQSLAQSLSTFSGHIGAIRRILEGSERGVLVLLDELMGGTDPNEGSALALATVDALMQRQTSLVVTTHYEALKHYAMTEESLASGAVGFDFEKMEPTFVVEMGRPGASSALIVAEKHQLPTAIVRRAEALLPEIDARQRQDVIDLEQLRADAENEKRALAKSREEQERLNRQLENEKRRIEETRRKLLEKDSDDLRNAIREARAELRQLRSQAKSGDVDPKKLDRDLDQIAAQVAVGSPVDRKIR